MTDCIFCKIVRGEIPCVKICEDENVLSFLDIGPINPGHALVIPKAHYATLFDTPVEALQQCISVVRRVAPAVFKATGAEGMNVLQNNYRASGQMVDHIHFHLIPRYRGDGFMPVWPAKSITGDALQDMLIKVVAAL